MIRVAIEIVLLFLLPAAVYFGYVLLARPNASPAVVVNEAPLVWLSIAGAVLVGAMLVYYGLEAGGRGIPEEAHAPAGSKDGRVRPGRND
jgi:hypothetical protein